MTRYAVLAESPEECAAGLARLCDALGLESTVGPVRLTDGRWLARAVTPAPGAHASACPVMRGAATRA